jgi:hypothetical protein
VRYAGHDYGRFVLTPRTGVAPSREARQGAVILADQVAARLADQIMAPGPLNGTRG